MIVGIDHVQLAMPPGREAEARAFYEGLLGLPEMPKPPELAKRGGAWFESGAVKLHLGVEADFRPARKAHPALLVRDLPGLLQRLRAAGVEVVEDPLEGYLRAYAADPFGNRLELMEPIATL
jgi:catechol 2,3-dioxygenase-like lactoylglutathione lyase family enzyme